MIWGISGNLSFEPDIVTASFCFHHDALYNAESLAFPASCHLVVAITFILYRSRSGLPQYAWYLLGGYAGYIHLSRFCVCIN